VLLCDKPAGVTSHDVVAGVRRRLGRGVKVGHAGTLPKRYETVARLGWTSTTGDPEGEIVEGRMPAEPLVLPTGRIMQRPPAYSAVKVGGRRAYAMARAGEAVELAEREVHVYEFSAGARDGERAAFTIECSAGTYVRTLISELGDAYCVELRRTRIGAFDVADADPERLIGLDDALDFIPALSLTEDAARRAGHGVAVEGVAEGVVRLRDEAGLIALGEPREDGLVKPIVGFRG
jgi:tRNA pseudouridine55 synthase